MSTKRRNKRVTDGTSRITVYPWTHKRTGAQMWRFGWKDAGTWRYITRKTKDEAVAAAETVLQQMGNGLIWEALRPEDRAFLGTIFTETTLSDREAVIAFIRSRKSSADIADAVARFLEFKKTAKGKETERMKQTRRDLEHLAAYFPGRPVSDILEPEISVWWKTRTGTAGNSRAMSIRTMAVMFWSWCRKFGLVPNVEITEADKLVTLPVGIGTKFIYTPRHFLRMAATVEPCDRAWVVLQAFGGFRPEEAAPKSTSDKRGIRAEEIDWRFKMIRVPREVSKTTDNTVPLNDALRAWLDWAGIREGMVGPICGRNPAEERLTQKYGEKVFGKAGWPKDALRHSYASYRNAELRNLPHLAEEMRTSVRMLNNHYHNPRAEEEGRAWFSLRPEDLERVPIWSDEDDVTTSGVAGFRPAASA